MSEFRSRIETADLFKFFGGAILWGLVLPPNLVYTGASIRDSIDVGKRAGEGGKEKCPTSRPEVSSLVGGMKAF